VELKGIEGNVLQLLDGRRTRAELLDLLLQAVRRDEVEIREHGEPIHDPNRLREVLSPSLEPILDHLAKSALLLG
jgi:methyltransferase-like protein